MKEMKRIATIAKAAMVALMACVLPHHAAADDVRTVEATYTYYGNGEQSRNQCKALALEGARSEALAKAFGRTVSTTIFERETVSDERLLVSGLSVADRGQGRMAWRPQRA